MRSVCRCVFYCIALRCAVLCSNFHLKRKKMERAGNRKWACFYMFCTWLLIDLLTGLYFSTAYSLKLLLLNHTNQNAFVFLINSIQHIIQDQCEQCFKIIVDRVKLKIYCMTWTIYENVIKTEEKVGLNRGQIWRVNDFKANWRRFMADEQMMGYFNNAYTQIDMILITYDCSHAL